MLRSGAGAAVAPMEDSPDVDTGRLSCVFGDKTEDRKLMSGGRGRAGDSHYSLNVSIHAGGQVSLIRGFLMLCLSDLPGYPMMGLSMGVADH